MAHPTYWPRSTFFYPIGNTPAVCLTQELAPEEHAKILLFACGDPRNILFTIFADGMNAGRRKIDFTCCDAEPAVLARNILLFTLIVDDDSLEALSRTWNIFYHLYLDKDSIDRLLSQCRKLVDMSGSLESWQASKYSSFLKMANRHTVSELHHHWALYLTTKNFSSSERRQFDEAFRLGMQAALDRSKGEAILTAIHSAGPLWMGVAAIANDIYHHFWTTGTTLVKKQDVQLATYPNPTFAYSVVGERFAVHYGTDPVLSFHLASALADLESVLSKTPKGMTEVLRAIKKQFFAWSRVFQASLGSVVIRFFSGDALALCHTLQHCHTNRGAAVTYTGPWTSTLLRLDSIEYGGNPDGAPTSFNVIDTSNIADHVGLVNILVAARGVLSRSPSSTLYTTALIRDINPVDKRVFGDVPTIGLTLDLMPATHLSNISTSCDGTTLLPGMGFVERLSWKIPSSGDPHYHVSCDPLFFDAEHLSRFLFQIYVAMFANESRTTLFSKPSLALIHKSNIIHYGRRAFAMLLKTFQDRVKSDWNQTMSRLIDLIEQDRTLFLGLNYYQDLCCQLHLLGVYTVSAILQNPGPVNHSTAKELFAGWQIQIPPLVCVALVVPRSKVKVLEEMDIGSPVLHCEVRGNTFHNAFTSFQICFGRLSRANTGCATIEEDPAGWQGSSSLVVSFWMPAWILFVEPHTTHVSLSVRSTFATASLVPVLGLRLDIFVANVRNVSHVFVLKERPDFPEELERSRGSTYHGSKRVNDKLSKRPATVSLSADSKKLSSMTIKIDLSGDAKLALRDGASVAAEQTSPCATAVAIGRHKEVVVFPFPIDGARTKLRIARKSSYIEVVVPAGLSSSSGYARYPFSMASVGEALAPWGMHRLILGRQPALDTNSVNNLPWIKNLLQLAASRRTNDADAMANIKDTINTIFYMALGLDGMQVRVFSLSDQSTEDNEFLIFVSKIRLELASPTIVADAYVLCMSQAVLSSAAFSIDFTGIKVTPAEMLLWKRLLPPLAERCRDWSHKDDCAYIVRGCVPVSLEGGTSPLCGCGCGQSVGGLDPRWKPVAHLVTRIALGPLFAVPYPENASSGINPSTRSSSSSAPSLRAPGSVPVSAAPSSATVVSPVTSSVATCATCGGHGKPKLLVCSRCKRTSYCSQACQKEDWKFHKATCSRG